MICIFFAELNLSTTIEGQGPSEEETSTDAPTGNLQANFKKKWESNLSEATLKADQACRCHFPHNA